MKSQHDKGEAPCSRWKSPRSRSRGRGRWRRPEWPVRTSAGGAPRPAAQTGRGIGHRAPSPWLSNWDGDEWPTHMETKIHPRRRKEDEGQLSVFSPVGRGAWRRRVGWKEKKRKAKAVEARHRRGCIVSDWRIKPRPIALKTKLQRTPKELAGTRDGIPGEERPEKKKTPALVGSEPSQKSAARSWRAPES